MNKYLLILSLLLFCTTAPMDKFKYISPGANTQQLITLAVIDKVCPTLVGDCAQYTMNPFSIVRVTELPCLPPELRRDQSRRFFIRQDESYQVDLKNGLTVICEYKQMDPESGHIDACIIFPGQNFPLPISIQNFFVAKHYFEATKLSYFK